jgi:SnoaL-like domain
MTIAAEKQEEPRMVSFESWFAVNQLILEFSQAVDMRDYNRIPGLLAADAVLELVGVTAPDLPARGRDAVVDAIRRRHELSAATGGAWRHVITNVVFREASEKRICTTTIMHVIVIDGRGPGIRMVGSYEDEFARNPEGWQFAFRRWTSDVDQAAVPASSTQ